MSSRLHAAYVAYGKTHWVCAGEPQVALGLCISRGEHPADVRLFMLPPGLRRKSSGDWTITDDGELIVRRDRGKPVEIDVAAQFASVVTTTRIGSGKR